MAESVFDKVKSLLVSEPRRWLVTGVAGFVGSHLLEHLLRLNQHVVGVDNYLSGTWENLEIVRSKVNPSQWARFQMLERDLRDMEVCREACRDVELVLHQAAVASVPQSIEDPVGTNEHNVCGTLNLMTAARDAGVKRFVYASSSAVYGDSDSPVEVEERAGRPMSPYAVTKQVCELYASQFFAHYGLQTIGLRYFNIFGPRQSPDGPYAAVIPIWATAMLRGEPVHVYGTGETTRDFCYIENTVQANLLAAMTSEPAAQGEVFNVALGERLTLLELFELLRAALAKGRAHLHLHDLQPVHKEFRPGDILHSMADVSKARRLLGYEPTHTVEQGITETVSWYENLALKSA